MIFFRIEALTQMLHDAFVVCTGSDPARPQSHARGIHDDLLQTAPHIHDGQTVIFERGDGHEEFAGVDGRPDGEMLRDILEPNRGCPNPGLCTVPMYGLH